MASPEYTSKIGAEFATAMLDETGGDADAALLDACERRGYGGDDLHDWAHELVEFVRSEQPTPDAGPPAPFTDEEWIAVTSFAAGLVVADDE